MTNKSESYVYAEEAAPKGAPLLLLFHGTGGSELGLLGLGRQLAAGHHLISPRGDVSEGGALRFFRRTGEGVYDMADLARATTRMRGFIAAQIERLQPSSVAALGYSNGANILASVLFDEPTLADAAVLMHPLIPFDPAPQPALEGKKILITAGRRDPICPPDLTTALASWFAAQGAQTDTAWQEGGHELQQQELVAVREFLARA